MGLKVTRKYFAVTGSNEMVFSGALPPCQAGHLTEVLPIIARLQRFLWSRDSVSAPAFQYAGVFGDPGHRANRLRGQGIRIESMTHEPAAGIGTWVVFSRSPSLNIAASRPLAAGGDFRRCGASLRFTRGDSERYDHGIRIKLRRRRPAGFPQIRSRMPMF